MMEGGMEEPLDPDVALVLDQLVGHWQDHSVQGTPAGFCGGCAGDWPCPGFEALEALERIVARLP